MLSTAVSVSVTRMGTGTRTVAGGGHKPHLISTAVSVSVSVIETVIGTGTGTRTVTEEGHTPT